NQRHLQAERNEVHLPNRNTIDQAPQNCGFELLPQWNGAKGSCRRCDKTLRSNPIPQNTILILWQFRIVEVERDADRRRKQSNWAERGKLPSNSYHPFLTKAKRINRAFVAPLFL